MFSLSCSLFLSLSKNSICLMFHRANPRYSTLQQNKLPWLFGALNHHLIRKRLSCTKLHIQWVPPIISHEYPSFVGSITLLVFFCPFYPHDTLILLKSPLNPSYIHQPIPPISPLNPSYIHHISNRPNERWTLKVGRLSQLLQLFLCLLVRRAQLLQLLAL